MAKNVVVQFIGDEKDLTRAFKSSQDQGSKFGSFMKDTLSTAAGVAFEKIGQAALSFAKDAMSGYREHNKVAAQTEAAIKSTGGAAKTTADDVEALADALERKTTIDGDAIQSGQNMLLTFTNIRNEAGLGNDVFNQATKTLLDMSVATGTDAAGSAIQLGKALNDPIAGVGALSRVGVTFTEQQKEQIKAMVEAGNVAGAQKIILAELNKEFGGSAEALGKAQGPLGQFTVGLNQVKDAVGKVLVEDALPGLVAGLFGAKAGGEGVTKTMGDLAKAIEDAGPKIRKTAEDLGSLISKVKQFVGPVWEMLGEGPIAPLFDSNSQVRKQISGQRASGGPTAAGMSYLVGEKGPEVWTSSSNGWVTPNGGGGSVVIVNVYPQGTLIGTMEDLTDAVRDGLLQSGRLNVSALGNVA